MFIVIKMINIVAIIGTAVCIISFVEALFSKNKIKSRELFELGFVIGIITVILWLVRICLSAFIV